MDNDFACRLLQNLNNEFRHPSFTKREIEELAALHEANAPFWEQRQLEDIRGMCEGSRTLRTRRPGTKVQEDK